MTESEIIELLAEKTGRSKTECAQIVRGFKDIAREALKNREQVVLRGFGVLLVKKFKKRPLFGERRVGYIEKVCFEPSRRRPL